MKKIALFAAFCSLTAVASAAPKKPHTTHKDKAAATTPASSAEGKSDSSATASGNADTMSTSQTTVASPAPVNAAPVVIPANPAVAVCLPCQRYRQSRPSRQAALRQQNAGRASSSCSTGGSCRASSASSAIAVK